MKKVAKRGKAPSPNFVWDDNPPGWKLKPPPEGSYPDELSRLRAVIREQGLEIMMHQARITQLESLLGDVIDDELDSTPAPKPTKKPLKIKRSKK